MRYSHIYNCRGQNGKIISPLLRDGELELARNISIDDIGRWKKRYGTSIKNAQIVDGNTILGLYNFITSGGTSYHLTAVNDTNDTNADIFLDVNGTWTLKLADWTKDVRIRFLTFLNRVIVFNGTDAPKSSADGDTWNTTGLTNAPTAKYGVVHKNYCFMAANSTYPDRLWWSNPATYATALAWTATDALDINPSNGDNITGLEVNNNRLIIFKERSMYRWNHDTETPDYIIDIGSVSQESVKTSNGITYFLGRSHKDIGVYAYSGGFPKLISTPVKKFIDAMDMSILSTTSAYITDDTYGVWIGDVTNVEIADEARSFTDVILIYTISRDEWTIYTDTPARIFASFISSGAEYVYFGDNDGNVMKFNDTTVFSENGSDIEVEIISKMHLINEAEKMFKLNGFYAEASRPSSLAITYRRNNEIGFYGKGGILQKMYDWFRGNDEINRIQFRLADISTADLRIEGYVIDAEPLKKDVNNGLS